MDENYLFLLREMVNCKGKIAQLQEEISHLEDNYNCLREMYYWPEYADVRDADLRGLYKKIHTDGFIIGIKF